MSILKKSICLIIFAFLFGFFSEYAMEEKEPENKKRKIEEEAEVSHKKQKTSEPLSEEQRKKIASNLFENMLEAIQKGDVEWIKKFIEHYKGQKGFHVFINRVFKKNKKNTTFLLIALEEDQFKIAQLLIENDLLTPETLNIQNENGCTALILALMKNYTEIVELLITKKGINLDIQNEDGNSALIIAAQEDWEYAVRLLLENGAKLNLKNKLGNTALICAVLKVLTYLKCDCNIDTVSLLVEKGADLDIQNNEGITALMSPFYGMLNGKIIRLLTINGARWDIQDNSQETPLSRMTMVSRNIYFQEFFDEIGVDEVIAYKNNSSNESSLYNAIKPAYKKSKFNKDEWLKLALLLENAKQIDYCIKNELLSKEEVENQKIYLKLRSKSSKELLKLIENKTYTPLDILRALSVQPEDIMPIDVNIAANLLEYTTPEERTSIMKLAQKHDNKKLGKKIIDFNNNIRLFTNKKNKPLPEELSKKIATYF